jgi:enoyl-CoA hydratase/carnithine racemase
VQLDQQGPALVIRLNRPDARNAFDAAMRDALTEALAFAIEHPDRPPVVLEGAGPAFSSGGDLDPTPEYVASTMRFAAVLHELGYTSRTLAEAEVFDRRLIDAVHPEPPHFHMPLSESIKTMKEHGKRPE